MRNIPTDIYIENGAVKNHGGEIAELGKKAMIVTGRHSSAVNGSLDDVRAVLESQGIGYVIYNDIEENPSVETVYTAATAAVKYGVDMFVAVGGGSPMDASKAISMLAKNGIVCETTFLPYSLCAYHLRNRLGGYTLFYPDFPHQADQEIYCPQNIPVTCIG